MGGGYFVAHNTDRLPWRTGPLLQHAGELTILSCLLLHSGGLCPPGPAQWRYVLFAAVGTAPADYGVPNPVCSLP